MKILWICVIALMANAATVDVILIEGNQRIEQETIHRHIAVKEGQSVTEETLNDILKKLHSLGFFSDVKVTLHGSKMVVSVVENPSINRVAYEGNNALSDKILEAQVQIKPRMLFTRSKVQEEVQRILAMYRSKGYFNARIEPKIVRREQNRVDVIFEIQEGDVAEVRKIRFFGNKVFSEARLQSVILTKESKWWRFFSTEDIFDEDRLDLDRERLRKFYLNQGYVDFQVLSATAELLPKEDAFIISFSVDEGERYAFGAIHVDNKLENLKIEKLSEKLLAKKGDYYAADTVELDTQAITEFAGDQGYAFVRITPKPKRNPETKTVDIVYVIEPSEKVFIRSINIKGNTRTVDQVIRRQFTLSEGDAFSVSKIKASDRNIENLGFFKQVNMQRSPVSGDNQHMDINVEVKEQSTGEINFSAGFSTTDGPLGLVSIRERNLFGRALVLSSYVQMAKRSRNFNVTMANPYFMNRDLEVGFHLDRGQRDQKDWSSFKQDNLGVGSWMQYHLSEPLSQRLSYNFSHDKISGLSGNASRYIREQQGTTRASVFGQTLIYDKRDLKFGTRRGFIVTLGNDYAGLGGDVKFFRTTLSATTYHHLFGDTVLSLEGGLGMISPQGGKKLRVIDKFTLGGYSLRGFEDSGVGPRSRDGNEDALGGDRMAHLTAEVTFPLGQSIDSGFKGGVFIDAGTTWDSRMGKTNATIYNSKDIRLSTGFGVGWASPMGVIRIDFGFPLRKVKGDKEQLVLFNIGTGRF